MNSNKQLTQAMANYTVERTTSGTDMWQWIHEDGVDEGEFFTEQEAWAAAREDAFGRLLKEKEDRIAHLTHCIERAELPALELLKEMERTDQPGYRWPRLAAQQVHDALTNAKETSQ